jgi:hypothetical protein
LPVVFTFGWVCFATAFLAAGFPDCRAELEVEAREPLPALAADGFRAPEALGEVLGEFLGLAERAAAFFLACGNF